MKRLLLLLIGGGITMGANGQYAKNVFNGGSVRASKKAISELERAYRPLNLGGTARTTATAFATETFGSGTASTLPTGWTAGSFVGTGTWKWTNVATTGSYSIGTIASTTAADGWMVYDSDGIGAAGSVKPSGWMQSPVYNCATHSTVRLTFQEKFVEFNDSCQIWVCHTTGGAPTWAAGTYTSYGVFPNNNLDDNASTANPETVHINITAEAGGQANVYIRFVYYSNSAGGSFNWLVDDINLAELDPTDIGISSSFLFNNDAALTYSTTLFSTPLRFVDSVAPVTFLSNLGANAVASTSLNAQIFQGSTSVYSQPATFAGLAYDKTDTAIIFPKYKPTAIGVYTVAVSATAAGDADASNNVDSVVFAVTDTTWQESIGKITGAFNAFNPTTSTALYVGTRFDVPSTVAGDTVSGFGVAFDNTTAVTNSGGKVSVQLYSHATAGGWVSMGTSVARPLAASDISSASTVVWADFRSDPVTSGGYLVLTPGNNYAAVVQVEGVTTATTVLVTNTPSASPSCGFFGQIGTSGNDGLSTFGPTDATGLGSIPMVRMYFGSIRPVAVDQLTTLANMVGKAFPNPANTEVSVPFTLNTDGAVTVTLTNVIGQTIATQTINAANGVASKATFATGKLADGVYIYTVKVNGQQTTGRVVVAH